MRTKAGLLLLLCLALRGASPATAAPVSITFGKGIRQLQKELYPSGEGSHATASEVALTWYKYPETMQRKDMVILVDEKRRFVGCALTEQIECRNAKSPCDERVAISGPQFGILGQPIDQHVGRRCRRTVTLGQQAGTKITSRRKRV